MTDTLPRYPESGLARAYAEKVRDAILAKVDEPGADLVSIFLIGSLSAGIPDEWYQDFDIHFRFRPIVLGQNNLAWMWSVLDACKALEDRNCRIETAVRDRHWKMVPDGRVPVNVGVHATLLNAADHFRRVHYNPILSNNMYTRCGVLLGEHPRQIVGFRPMVAADHLHSVGGLSWMVENFTRMVGLHVLQPNDRTFYPFVAGYCWNAASTLMFHLASLERGGVYGRTDAFAWLLDDPACPAHVKAAAEIVYDRRETPDTALSDAPWHINRAAKVVRYVFDRACSAISVGRTDGLPDAPQQARTLFGSGVTEPLDLKGGIRAVDVCVPDSGDDFYGAVEEALDTVRLTADGALSVKENFEMLRDARKDGDPPVRVYLWTTGSAWRRRLSFDFAYDRGQPTLESALFNWEDGAQALLQRLNEVFIEKRGSDAELAALCATAGRLVDGRFSELGVDEAVGLHRNTDSGDFDRTTRVLHRLLAPYVYEGA